MTIGTFIISLIALIVSVFGIFMIKEYRRIAEEGYNRWLYTIGLHETSCYFNPSGIRILNDWLLLDKDVL